MTRIQFMTRTGIRYGLQILLLAPIIAALAMSPSPASVAFHALGLRGTGRRPKQSASVGADGECPGNADGCA